MSFFPIFFFTFLLLGYTLLALGDTRVLPMDFVLIRVKNDISPHVTQIARLQTGCFLQVGVEIMNTDG